MKKSKSKKRYVCRECGNMSPSWIGKCPECHSWNSFDEEIIEKPRPAGIIKKDGAVVKIEDVVYKAEDSVTLNCAALNDFFGEGIVAGAVTLLAGEPGIGKSTFLFYLSNNIPPKYKIFYFSGEESRGQIKKRFDRVGKGNLNLYLSNEVEVESIIKRCEEDKPDIIFIDSIQTCYSQNVDSTAGTVSQMRHSSSMLVQYAKANAVPVFIIGHVTKAGDIAGPKIVEHMVDAVVHFESDFKNQFRVLRSLKNRFGSIDEILLFEMMADGLHLIENPSEFFIENDPGELNVGKCKTVIMEGKRPFIIEVEALAVPSSFPNPRRFSEGVDVKRLNRIAAILNKHLEENLNNYDIYFNISGGIKTSDVAIDLAVAAAIYSSKNKVALTGDLVCIGEVSLTGKVRNVYKAEQRIKECIKFGFKRLITPALKTNEQPNKVIYSVSELKSLLSNMKK